jgi:hypothetical protein
MPLLVAVAPSPSSNASSVPADVPALSAARGSWLATLTVAGGRIAHFKQYVVGSDGSASSTSTGAIVLDARALARVSAAVSAAHDSTWSIPSESTCCDRVVTRITLAHRLTHGRSSTFTAQHAEGGTPLPAGAGALVDVLEKAFEPAPIQTSS